MTTNEKDQASRAEDTQYAAPVATAPTNEMVPHTPGPWTVDNCGRDVRAGGVGGLFVARIYAVPQEDNPSGYGDEQFANARLIAAAPDMLQALKAIRKWLMDGDTPAELLKPGEFWNDAFVKANNAAIAAIAKAEGR
jgi:hypothetical protein